MAVCCMSYISVLSSRRYIDRLPLMNGLKTCIRILYWIRRGLFKQCMNERSILQAIILVSNELLVLEYSPVVEILLLLRFFLLRLASKAFPVVELHSYR
jgi:hypothetical protein